MTFINQLSFSYYHPESPYNVKKNQPFCIDEPFCDGTITNLPSLVIMLTPFCKNWATWSFSWMPHIFYHRCDSLYIFFCIAIYWLFVHYLQPDNLYLLSFVFGSICICICILLYYVVFFQTWCSVSTISSGVSRSPLLNLWGIVVKC